MTLTPLAIDVSNNGMYNNLNTAIWLAEQNAPLVKNIGDPNAGMIKLIRVGDPLGQNYALPGGGLFGVSPPDSGGFLVTTQAGLGSQNDGMVDSDPLYDRTTKTERRLGDGLYEQLLVQQQLLALTGRTTLGGQADAQAQFAALVAGGVAYAERYALTPGIALSAAQMQALTSDIVWLEEREVTTPEGRQKVLVPVVYLASLSADDLATQSGITGNRVVLDVAGDLINQGTIAGESVLATVEGVIPPFSNGSRK